jgi:hypothetical protein
MGRGLFSGGSENFCRFLSASRFIPLEAGRRQKARAVRSKKCRRHRLLSAISQATTDCTNRALPRIGLRPGRAQARLHGRITRKWGEETSCTTHRTQWSVGPKPRHRLPRETRKGLTTDARQVANGSPTLRTREIPAGTPGRRHAIGFIPARPAGPDPGHLFQSGRLRESRPAARSSKGKGPMEQVPFHSGNGQYVHATGIETGAPNH